MLHDLFRLTMIGGPTAIIEWCGVRLLTDPTFDPAGTEYPAPAYTLRKMQGPARSAEELGTVDAVLLSHDHHADNLDRAGRDVVSRSALTLTTVAGATRLGAPAVGLVPGEARDVTRDGRGVRVLATAARHGPVHADRGPVIGFLLSPLGDPAPPLPDPGGHGGPTAATVYVSGDTVWYEGTAEIAARHDVRVAVLFAGAAKVAAVGDVPLTMTAADAVRAARAMPRATILPIHVEGWEHFSESPAVLAEAFEVEGLTARLRWPRAGETLEVQLEP